MEALTPASLHGRRRPWEDLPSELLGLVLLRIPSHASRVRLRAVCRSWRAGAHMQSPLPPLLPWLALRDGSFLSLPDGEVHRRILTSDDDVAHRVSTGSMLFLVHSHEGCSLMDPLSRESTAPRHVDLKVLRTRPGALLDVENIRKVVVVSDQVTAVRAGNNLTISVCRPRSFNLVWRWLSPFDTYCDYILDIAFFQEKLYVLTTIPVGTYPLCLYAVDIIRDKTINIPCVFTTSKDDVDRWAAHHLPHYLVESGERLLMVKQNWRTGIEVQFDKQAGPALFEVYEATDMSNSGGGRWRKIDTLMGHALFLSEGCSKSLPSAGHGCVGAQDDCIYFLSERYNQRVRRLYSGIYNMKDGTTSPLPFDMEAAHDGPLTTNWFFPEDM
ncbi:unnamed protein product [Alopecurus aequalis]